MGLWRSQVAHRTLNPVVKGPNPFRPATLNFRIFYHIILHYKQKLENFLTGIYYHAHCRSTLTVKLRSIDDFIAIDFVDTGNGISEESIEKIFEPLFTTKQKGTGLGLASCKNIVEQHHGTISVKNNPTTFSIQLPKAPQSFSETKDD